MARGGGARKVRPEGQPMRCVVQLLSTGGKSACARPRTELPRPYRDVVARDILVIPVAKSKTPPRPRRPLTPAFPASDSSVLTRARAAM